MKTDFSLNKQLLISLFLLTCMRTVRANAQRIYYPIDFSGSHNACLQIMEPGFPMGSLVLGGIPFNIPEQGNNFWSASSASGENPRTLDVDVGVESVDEVHTVINTYWGQPAPACYAWIEFFGDRGAYYRKNLLGNIDMRDFNNWHWTSTINGTTTTNVWIVNPGVYGIDRGAERRLDKQKIVLPREFLVQKLTRIRFSDNGGEEFQRIFVVGVNVHGILRRQPDLMLKKGSDPESKYAAKNVYQKFPSGNQIVTQAVPPGTPATYQIRVESNSSVRSSYVVTASENAEAGWTVTYRVGNTDITSQIRGPGRTTASLDPGESEIITVTATPVAGAPGLRSKNIVFRVYLDAAKTEVKDAVKAETTVIPDIRASLSISPHPGTVGGFLTARIAVTRSAYTDGFRLDFYRNLAAPPLPDQTGTNSVLIPAGTDLVIREIRFRPAQPGNFTAWVQVDTDGAVFETNEGNNTSSATYSVRNLSLAGLVTSAAMSPLPGVTVMAITSSSSTTVRSAVTDARGRYTITALSPALYTVTPARDGLAFEPPVRSVSLNAARPDVTGVDFIGAGIDITVSCTIEPTTAFAGSPLTAKITVSRSAATPGFWVDFYQNRATTPPAELEGNQYFFVPAGSGIFTQTLTFRPTAAGTFQAWVQADTDGFVSEINEANNIAGPVTYTVTVPTMGATAQGLPSKPPETSE